MFDNFNIAKIGHPILRKKTNEVDLNELKSDKIQNIIKKMIATMRNANGAGIAANQIYESFRICVVEVLNNNRYKHLESIPLKILINPKIVIDKESGTFNSYEGCLSVPDIRGKEKRYKKISLNYFDNEGKEIYEKIDGLEAIVYQHEIDHLDGYLFTDKVEDNTTLVTYKNYLKFHQEDYQKELNEFLKKIK